MRRLALIPLFLLGLAWPVSAQTTITPAPYPYGWPTITIPPTGVLNLPDGAAGAPALTFTLDPDSGLYRLGSNNLAIALNGTKAFDFSPLALTVPTGTAFRTGAVAGNTLLLQGYNTSGTPAYNTVATITAASGTPTLDVGGVLTLTPTLDGATVSVLKTGVTPLTDATATTVVTVALAAGDVTGGELRYVIQATDAGGDNDGYVGSIRFVAQRKGAAATCSVGTIGVDVTTKSHAGLDMAVTATCDATGGTSVILKLNADTALTATTLKAVWHLTMLRPHGAIS